MRWPLPLFLKSFSWTVFWCDSISVFVETRAVYTWKFRDLSFLKRSLHQKQDIRFKCTVEALEATANSATAKNKEWVLHSLPTESFFWADTLKFTFAGSPTTPTAPLRLQQTDTQFCGKLRVLYHTICVPWYCSRYSGSPQAGRARDRIPVEARFYAPVLTESGAQPASYTMATASFSGVKRLGRGVYHSPSYSVEVKERVELYLYSTSEPSWPIIGWTLTTTYGSCALFNGT